jgi:hypothetical protein
MVAALVLCAGSTSALAQGAAFTYQGQLKNSGAAVNSATDMEFSLWTAASGGSQVGSTVTSLAVPVSQGLFTNSVDFGVNPYTSGENLYLQIAVRNPVGSGSYVAMGSRQKITAAPFSLATRGINVNGAGNVGIGISNPAASFHVSYPAGAALNDAAAVFEVANCGGCCGQEAYQENIRLLNQNQNGLTGIGLLSATGSNINTTPNVWLGTGSICTDGTGQTDFRISTQTAPTTLTDRFIIKGASGNIGIGTESPAERMHMLGSTPVVRVEDNGVVKAELQLLESGSGLFGAYMRYDSVSNVCSLGSYTRNLPSPQVDAPLMTWTRGSGSASFAGNVSCVSLTQTSSRDFKQDITPLTGALGSIMKLRGVSYAWNDKAPTQVRGTRDIGFIADEMNDVLPDIVAKDTSGKPLGIDYGKVTPVAVEAIKQLKGENDLLKARLEKLEALMAAQSSNAAAK